VEPVKGYWEQSATRLAWRVGDRVAWEYHFDPAGGKPYFHPVRNEAGAVVTAWRPADHPWHRGIWWSWKFLNGVNYWEENAAGISEGRTMLRATRVEARPGLPARVEQEIEYLPVLKEYRRLEMTGPRIGWHSEFTAVAPVRLDRVPIAGEPNGQTWGGYAGLSVRLAAGVSGLRDSEGRTEARAMHGQRAAWVEFGGIRVVPRQPSRWYVWSEGMNYFSPAVLYDGPWELTAGEQVKLDYEIWLP